MGKLVASLLIGFFSGTLLLAKLALLIQDEAMLVTYYNAFYLGCSVTGESGCRELRDAYFEDFKEIVNQ